MKNKISRIAGARDHRIGHHQVFSSTWQTSQPLQNPFYTEKTIDGKWLQFGVIGDATSKLTDSHTDYLYSLYARSIIHSKLIDHKAQMTYGGGWDESLLTPEVINNGGMEPLNKVLFPNCWDNEFIGGLALIIHWSRDSAYGGNPIPGYIEHVPISNVRMGSPYNKDYKDLFGVCENWSMKNRFGGFQGRVEEYFKFSLDPMDIKNHPVQLYYRPMKKIGNGKYPIPPYGINTDCFETAYEIGKFHLTGLKRGAFIRTHIHNENGLPSQVKQDMDVLNFNQTFIGTQGETILHTYGKPVTINPINLGVSDKMFLDLWDVNTEAIFTAHGIDRTSLVGKKDGMTIGNQEWMELIEKSQVNNINFTQEFIEECYKEIYSKSGLNIQWKIKKWKANLRKLDTTTNDILMILSSQVPDMVKIELLKDAGIDEPERYIAMPNTAQPTTGQGAEVSTNTELSEESKPVNSILTNATGKQSQGVDRIIRKYLKGTYTKSQAVIWLVNGFGYTTESAMDYLKAVDDIENDIEEEESEFKDTPPLHANCKCKSEDGDWVSEDGACDECKEKSK